MNSPTAIGFGLLVLAAVVLLVWRILIYQKPASPRDTHLLALQAWLLGDLSGAADLLQQVIREDPHSVDPYLQLGDLMRLMGDPQRAAILHRGLTVRPELDTAKKVQVGLSLTEDLLELGRFEEAGQVLDPLVRFATAMPRYWQARFRQWLGLGNLPDAARSLKHARARIPEHDRPWFDRAYASFQLDRALTHALAREGGEARARLKDVAKLPAAGERGALVRAILAAAEGDPRAALEEAAANLMDSPRELGLFLPFLERVLLEHGQYARSIPILERACLGDGAPAGLSVHLALLYEKLGQRDKALQLLSAKKGSGDFTPDTAAPFLRLLAAGSADKDFKLVWNALAMPRAASVWKCSGCGFTSERIRWFCPRCRLFDSFARAAAGAQRRPDE